MATFAVTYSYSADSDAARLEKRDEHIAFLTELHESGRLQASGRFGPEAEAGALLIIAGADPDGSGNGGDTVESIATLMDGDPFAKAGLLATRTIRHWTIVFGTVGQQA